MTIQEFDANAICQGLKHTLRTDKLVIAWNEWAGPETYPLGNGSHAKTLSGQWKIKCSYAHASGVTNTSFNVGAIDVTHWATAGQTRHGTYTSKEPPPERPAVLEYPVTTETDAETLERYRADAFDRVIAEMERYNATRTVSSPETSVDCKHAQ